MASEPHEVLNENGFDVPGNVNINVVANTRKFFHVTFPPDPNTAMSDEALALVSAGSRHGLPSSTVGSLVTSLSSVAVWDL